MKKNLVMNFDWKYLMQRIISASDGKSPAKLIY